MIPFVKTGAFRLVSKSAPVPTVTSFEPSASTKPRRVVPPVSETPPVKPVLELLSNNVPAPDFVKPTVPAMTALIVAVFAPPTTEIVGVAPSSVKTSAAEAPEIVYPPLLNVSPFAITPAPVLMSTVPPVLPKIALSVLRFGHATLVAPTASNQLVSSKFQVLPPPPSVVPV